jgi:hypothetical protein
MVSFIEWQSHHARALPAHLPGAEKAGIPSFERCTSILLNE